MKAYNIKLRFNNEEEKTSLIHMLTYQMGIFNYISKSVFEEKLPLSEIGRASCRERV